MNCYVFGASNCGKTSLLRHFVGKPTLLDSSISSSEHYSVIDRITYDKKDYYLIITEFEDKEIPFVLKSEELMGKCDVALLLYDGNDKFSFSFLEHIQRELEPSIPCVYMLTKYDLPIVDQENLAVTPQQFCEALALIWPPYLCSLTSQQGLNNIKTLFSDLLEVAMNPEESGCLPKWSLLNEAEDDDLQDDTEDGEVPKESLAKRTVKIAGFVSILGLVTYMMVKWIKKSKE